MICIEPFRLGAFAFPGHRRADRVVMEQAAHKPILEREARTMDRVTLRRALLEQIQQETGETYEVLPDDVGLREGLGLDSIDVVTLVIGIQTRFGVELKPEELEKIATVGDLLDLLQAKLLASRTAA
jgi:acyl carrier protein